MSFVELSDGGADGLRSRAVQLSGKAEDLTAQIHSTLAEIAAIEAEQPWGKDDAYAEQFVRSYDQPTDQGPFHEAVDKQASDLGPEATDMGQALSAGATDYQTGDLQAGHDINGVV